VIEIEGEPWFVANDVCRALNLAVMPNGQPNVTDALRKVGEDEKGFVQIETPGGRQRLKAVTESGLYKIVMRSDKPEARAFQDWVTRVVLPSIRKHGGYIAGQEQLVKTGDGRLELLARAHMVAMEVFCVSSRKRSDKAALRDGEISRSI